MDNKNNSWAQGVFIDGLRHARENEPWKAEQRSRESVLVRPSPTGNAICHATTPDAAEWIAQRLNLAANLQRAAGELVEHFSGGKYNIGDRSINDAVAAVEKILSDVAPPKS